MTVERGASFRSWPYVNKEKGIAETQRSIRRHDEFGNRLFWYMDASDAMLERLHASCTVLLAPSEGEGFGLPLIEAARHNLPILCRDLPVFREVAGDHATYFSGADADSLAVAIRNWLAAYQRGAVPAVGAERWLTWAESAAQLSDVVLGKRDDMNATSNHRNGLA